MGKRCETCKWWERSKGANWEIGLCTFYRGRLDVMPYWARNGNTTPDDGGADCPAWEGREIASPRKDSDADWYVVEFLGNKRQDRAADIPVLARCILDLYARIEKAKGEKVMANPNAKPVIVPAEPAICPACKMYVDTTLFGDMGCDLSRTWKCPKCGDMIIRFSGMVP